jgi:preprotein translocase subunit SecF
MEFVKLKRDLPFMRYAPIFNVISVIIFITCVVSLATRGLNFGIDFTGGTVVEVTYPQPADLNQVRATMVGLGFHDAIVQHFGTARDVLIRLPLREGVTTAALSDAVLKELARAEPGVKMQRVEFVGPQVGRELFENGALALLFVSLGIVIYLWFRFEWKFGVAGIIANLHDVIVILGIFSLFQLDFSLPVLAAVLAILGYSVNESVVLFDRVREVFRSRRGRQMSVPQVLDHAITRTLSRTIITHLSTQLMVLSMLIFGGEVLFHFALALTIGILFGIYSSNLIACPLVMYMRVSAKDLAKPEKKAEPEAVV